ncbi:MAG TPA: hypothetical protein VK472_05020 [Allosphingosinicella sp.]|nr:hypothetical protein [Allosphingosinicella sp.]
MNEVINPVERAERASRGRAAIMAIAAVVFIINAVIEFGHPAYSLPGVRGAIWPLIVLAWLAIVANGGGFRMRRQLCDVMNDELSLHNRARATAIGFYATNIAAVAVYYASWQVPMMIGDALQLVTGIGVSTALLVYAWLEWN